MKIASRSTMIELFGLENIKQLESRNYEFSQSQSSNPNLVKFEAQYHIGPEGDETTLVAVICHPKDVVDQSELDDICWDTPDYYGYQ